MATSQVVAARHQDRPRWSSSVPGEPFRGKIRGEAFVN